MSATIVNFPRRPDPEIRTLDLDKLMLVARALAWGLLIGATLGGIVSGLIAMMVLS